MYHGCNIGESDSFTERTIHVPCTKSPTGTHLWDPNFRGEGDTFNAVTMQILCSLFEDFHQNIVNLIIKIDDVCYIFGGCVVINIL